MIYRSVRARGDELPRSLPGDELLPTARSLTHAITIRASRHDVWPWLVQMGAGRAGWYSYDRIDNGGRPSLEYIAPELQHIALGDVFPAMPGVTESFVVLGYEAERFLILGWLAPTGTPVMTWSFVLNETEPQSTRLIVRARGGDDYSPPFGLPQWTVNTLVPLGHAIMQRKQLVGIARRAEGELPAWRPSFAAAGAGRDAVCNCCA